MDVEVARVPACARARGSRVVGGRLVGLVAPVARVAERDLDPPGDLAVAVALRLRGDRRDAQLDRPLAGRHRARLEAAGGPAVHVPPRAGEVLRLAREPVGRDGHVGMARPAPAAELVLVEEAVGAARVVEAEVEDVLDLRVRRRLGLVVAVLDAHRRRAGGHVEREQHVRALHLGPELAGHDERRAEGAIRVAGAGPRHGLIAAASDADSGCGATIEEW